MAVAERGGILPEPLLRGYWIPDPKSKDPEKDMLLRPNFNLSYREQEVWHKEVAERIKESGLGFGRGVLTQAEVNQLTVATITDRMASCYKHIRTKFKNQADARELERKNMQVNIAIQEGDRGREGGEGEQGEKGTNQGDEATQVDAQFKAIKQIKPVGKGDERSKRRGARKNRVS